MAEQYYYDPEWTGEITPYPSDWEKMTGGRWILMYFQWEVVARAILRAMFAAGPANEEDNVGPVVVPAMPGWPGTEVHGPPGVIQTAAMLLNALMTDPYKLYGSVRWGSRINWANYSCLAAWFHSLSDVGRKMFVEDVKAGRVNRWIPAVRDIAMAACPSWAYHAPFRTAKDIMAADVDPYSSHTDIKTDPDNAMVAAVMVQAVVGTPYEGQAKGFVYSPTLDLPVDLSCQPFPACMLEQLVGTSPEPAQVDASGRTTYVQPSEYESSGEGEQLHPPGEEKTGMPAPPNYFLGAVFGLAGGGAMYGVAALLGAGTVGRVVAGAAGAIAGGTVGGRMRS